MRKYKCSIDWENNAIQIHSRTKRVTLPMVMETADSFTHRTTPTSEQTPVLFIQGTKDHEASTSKSTHVSPKDELELIHTARKPKPKTQKKHQQKRECPKTTMKWIPKTVLNAQGYYQGTTSLWLPKTEHKTIMYKPQQAKIHNETRSGTNERPRQSWYWRPKQPIQQKITRKNPQETLIAHKNQMKWVPKQQQPVPNLIANSAPIVAIPKQTKQIPMHENMEQKSRYLTIKERARALQIKLSGLHSLPTI